LSQESSAKAAPGPVKTAATPEEAGSPFREYLQILEYWRRGRRLRRAIT
jgi:hypothetical protein